VFPPAKKSWKREKRERFLPEEIHTPFLKKGEIQSVLMCEIFMKKIIFRIAPIPVFFEKPVRIKPG